MELKDYKNEIEEYLNGYFENKGTYNKRIYEASGYSVKVGGKRIRPALLLMTYNLYKEDYKRVMSMAAAIEMIHTYSLIHDDLPAMDNDDYRRGRLTNHKQFDEATAILAGDSLFLDPFGLMAEADLADSVKIKLIQALSQASGTFGMVAGQMLDMTAEQTQPSLADLAAIHRHKTGCLLTYPFLAAGLLVEVSQDEQALLEEIGQLVGLAFQVRDDILDVTADFETLGKTPKKDVTAQKATYPSLLGLDQSYHILEDSLNQALALVEKLEAKQAKNFVKLRALLERLRLDG